MAYYFLFPENDTTLYSHPSRINMNTGGDEILELVKERGDTDQNHYPSRILLKFKTEEIGSTIDNVIGSTFSSSAKINLELTSLEAKNILESHILEVYAVSQSWNEGTNKYNNLPSSSNGATWKHRDGSVLASSWATSSFSVGTTGSLSNHSTIPSGGGSWYTGSNFEAEQQFLPGESLDTNFDVTEIIHKISASYFHNQSYPTGIENNGFLIKTPDGIETNTLYSFGELQYFSVDTHTIYPPKLVFKWDDSDYVNQSTLIKEEGSLFVSLYNNKKTYNQNDVVKFRFNVRDKYPTRTFTTSSNYLNNGRFKSTCYYSIRDAHTEQEIIPFDTTYTKMSADTESSYFNLHMNGLQPERYYRILIKHINSDGTTIYDDNYHFKVVR